MNSMKVLQDQLNQIQDICKTVSIAHEARRQTVSDLLFIATDMLRYIDNENKDMSAQFKCAIEMIRIRTNGNTKTPDRPL